MHIGLLSQGACSSLYMQVKILRFSRVIVESQKLFVGFGCFAMPHPERSDLGREMERATARINPLGVRGSRYAVLAM